MAEDRHDGDGNGSVAHVQAFFRAVNERVWELTDAYVSSELLEILCECGREECLQPITISAEEYDGVRRFPTRFVVRPGHVANEVEREVETTDRYTIVEVFGDAGMVAVELDRRRRAAQASASVLGYHGP